MASTARKLVLEDPPTGGFMASVDLEKPTSFNQDSDPTEEPQIVVDLVSENSYPPFVTVNEAPASQITDERKGSHINRSKGVIPTLASLHTDINTHCFWTGNVSSLKGIGNHIICSQWYSHLGDQVRRNINRGGFGDFVNILGLEKPDLKLLQALAERWWDTTHTFHFDNIGELTMTPTDFSALTGLPIAGKQIWFDDDAHTKVDSIRRMFGKEMVLLASHEGVMSCNELFEEYANFPQSTKKEVDQLTRVFLLALIGSLICSDKCGPLNLKLMNCLDHIDDIGSYNWGGAALASMYNNMNALSRAGQTTGCMWKLWEAWARQYIIPLSNNSMVGHMAWPRVIQSIANNSSHACGTNDPSQDYSGLLRHVRVHEVNFHPWGSLDDEFPDYVRKSMGIASKRVLLHSPSGYAWYLGERVTRQVVFDSEPFVPVDPPSNMFDICNFTEAEIYHWTRGVDGPHLTATTDLSYEDYVTNFIKYPEYPTHKAQDDMSEDIVGISEIRIPPWQIKVAVREDDNVYHAIDIPRDTPSPYLPLMQHVKAVSAETATTLLRQIAGLTSIASRQTLNARESSMLTRTEGEMLLKSAEYKNEILRRQLETAENKIVELRSMFDCQGAKTDAHIPHLFHVSNVARSFGEKPSPSGSRCNHMASPKDNADGWDLSAPSSWGSKPKTNKDGLADTKRMKIS